jgi:hypothetical protein
MHSVFFVLGEDDPLFDLELPSFPPRGLPIHFGGRMWTVEEMELRVVPTAADEAHLFIWVQERRAH